MVSGNQSDNLSYGKDKNYKFKAKTSNYKHQSDLMLRRNKSKIRIRETYPSRTIVCRMVGEWDRCRMED